MRRGGGAGPPARAALLAGQGENGGQCEKDGRPASAHRGIPDVSVADSYDPTTLTNHLGPVWPPSAATPRGGGDTRAAS
ncbi:hypothetical protein GCM10027575_50350 [Phytohabitans suffuscus]